MDRSTGEVGGLSCTRIRKAAQLVFQIAEERCGSAGKCRTALDEQKMYWDQWVELVLEPAQQLPCVRNQFEFRSDGPSLVASITADSESIFSVSRNFLMRCNIQLDSLLRMERVGEQLDAQDATLWCSLTDIGIEVTDGAEEEGRVMGAGVDLGCAMLGPIPAVLLDVLCPYSEDYGVASDFIDKFSHICAPMNFGMSLFDRDPAYSFWMSFNVSGSGGGNLGGTGPRSSRVRSTTTTEKDEEEKIHRRSNSSYPPSRVAEHLFSSLLVFKAFGFPKPQDAVLRVLAASDPENLSVRMTFGSRGLAQLLLRVEAPHMDGMYARLATALGKNEDGARICRQVADCIGCDVTSICYLVDVLGFSLSSGFGSSDL